MSRDIQLNITKASFKDIFSKKSFEVLRTSCGANIEDDWNLLRELPPKWEDLLPSILVLVENQEKVERHFHLAGMGVEALRTYFLSLSLAEADNVNIARALLRACLDALSYGALLDRIHRERETRFEDSAALEKLIRDESKVITKKIMNEPRPKGAGRNAFCYLMCHLEDFQLNGGLNDPPIIGGVDSISFYNRLSKSVHEEVFSTDSFSFRTEAVWLLKLSPRFAKENIARHLFPNFASGAMRLGLTEAMKPILTKRRHDFIPEYIIATRILSEIIKVELQRIRG
jgi:hypothetical protein